MDGRIDEGTGREGGIEEVREGCSNGSREEGNNRGWEGETEGRMDRWTEEGKGKR